MTTAVIMLQFEDGKSNTIEQTLQWTNSFILEAQIRIELHRLQFLKSAILSIERWPYQTCRYLYHLCQFYENSLILQILTREIIYSFLQHICRYFPMNSKTFYPFFFI